MFSDYPASDACGAAPGDWAVARFQALADSLPLPVFMLDAVNACFYGNASWQARFGTPDATSDGAPGWLDRVSAAQRVPLQDALEQTRRRGTALAMELRLNDGDAAGQAWRLRASVLGSQPGALLVSLEPLPLPAGAVPAVELERERLAADLAGQHELLRVRWNPLVMRW